MPRLQTVEEAFQRADAFLSKYYAFKRPLSAKKEGDNWLLEYDVGVFGVEKVRLRIEAESGSIIDYTGPQSL